MKTLNCFRLDDLISEFQQKTDNLVNKCNEADISSRTPGDSINSSSNFSYHHKGNLFKKSWSTC